MNKAIEREDNYTRLNIDLAREILFYLEKSLPKIGIRISGFSDEEISYQIKMLNQAGYVEAQDASTFGKFNWIATSLTYKGHNFLNLIRDEKAWTEIKNYSNDSNLDFLGIESIAKQINDQKRNESRQHEIKNEIPEVSQKNLSDIVNNNGKVFGRNLKNLRTERGMSQQNLSNAVGLSPSYISRIENGAVGISQEIVAKLADFLGVSTALLTKDTEYEQFFELNDYPLTAENEDIAPTVQMSNVGDQPTDTDSLGFKPYVEAIAKFLTDEKTKGPLTLSVEGEWGSGKSSFMLQVEKELKSIDSEILTVHFNAWRYDKEDALWAAFATQVVKELSGKVSWRKRIKASWQLLWHRFDLRKGWFSFFSFILVVVSLIFLVLLVINNYLRNPSDIAPLGDLLTNVLDSKEGANFIIKFLTFSAAGYIILYVLTFKKIKEFLINPLAIDLKKHLKAPDYEQRITFLDEFHEDFIKIIKSYAGKGKRAKKVFVFIDDLDRCEVPKSAELMQSLNLMLSEIPQLFFIIGMDREKVAAGLAVKHEKLLPYLNFSSKETLSNVNPGLEYGYEFIEKFIQVPFKVPQPRVSDIKTLIEKLSESEENLKVTSDKTIKSIYLAAAIDGTHIPHGTNDQIYDSRTKQQKETSIKKDVDSLEIHEVIEDISPLFDYNPRRIKQFLNLFRLKIYIGNETGLFNLPPSDRTYKRVTLHKLGRFVAISLRYPLLIATLEEHLKLLDNLQRFALDENYLSDSSVEYWSSKTRLIQLLQKKLPKTATEADKDKYALTNIDVIKLLQVSPSTKSITDNSEQKPTQIEASFE